MQVTVSVTAEDIGRGRKMDEDWCPVALAAKRAVPSWETGMCVFAYFINIEGFFQIALPQQARDFIIAFDRYDPVEPLEFEIDVPDDLLPADDGGRLT
jgi:hypothetical protein